MSKKAYIGINGQPHNVKAMYVGVNGQPRKVVKGYVGVNGVPRLFFDGKGKTYSWHKWYSSVYYLFYKNSYGSDIGIVDIYKNSPKIMYYGFVYSEARSTYYPIFLSPDPDAVSFNFRYRYRYEDEQHVVHYDFNLGIDHNAWFDFVDSRGITWYGSGLNADSCFSFDTYIDLSSYMLRDEPFIIDPTDTPEEKKQKAIDVAKEMVDRIFALPFHENYRVWYTYNTYSWGVGKTQEELVMKVTGLWLLLNIHLYDDTTLNPTRTYKTFSDECLRNIYFGYHMREVINNSNYFYIYVNVNPTTKAMGDITIWSGASQDNTAPITQIASAHTKNGLPYYDLYANYSTTRKSYVGRQTTLEYQSSGNRWRTGSITNTRYEYPIGIKTTEGEEGDTYPYVVSIYLLTNDIELTEEVN